MRFFKKMASVALASLLLAFSAVSVNAEKKESKSNQGMNILLGHKYAYIKYSFTFVNWAGYGDKASPVYLEVNAVGTITTG